MKIISFIKLGRVDPALNCRDFFTCQLPFSRQPYHQLPVSTVTVTGVLLAKPASSSQLPFRLRGGSGGFEVKVGGHTQLDGAVIGSTADAGKNRLDTGALQAVHASTHPAEQGKDDGPDVADKN